MLFLKIASTSACHNCWLILQMHALTSSTLWRLLLGEKMLGLIVIILLRFWQLDMCVICGFMTDLGMITLSIKVHDLWKYNIASFHFPFSCVTISNIKKVSIIESGNDGWNIDSIVTLVGAGGRFKVLTQDLDVYRWIDGNGHHTHRRFTLTFA